MADPFNPKFVDLVRNFTSTQGLGNFVLGAPVTGFTSLANAVAIGERFYYCVTGVDKPAEREVGRGTRMADGTIAREPTSGAKTNFTSGTKSIALIVAADWFRSAGATATSLFSGLSTRTTAAAVLRIDTHGRTAIGVSPATYIRDPDQTSNTVIGQSLIDAVPAAEQAAAAAAVQTILSRVRIADASGVYWVIDDDNQQVHAGHFGALADGAFNNITGAITGTDNWAAIQALIDWRLYLRAGTPSARRPIVIPPGIFRISKQLQLGYGNGYVGAALRGSRISYETLGGTVLACDFDDQVGLALSGLLTPEVEDVTFVSKGSGWYLGKSVMNYNQTALATYGIDDRDIVNHHDPAYPQRAALLRYNPHAAIAIDPYGGAQPAAATSWAINTAIAQGAYRTANANLYIAASAGTTAVSGTGPSASTSNILDGTVRWDYVGPSSVAVAYPTPTMPAWLPSAARIGYGRTAGTTAPQIRRCQFYGFSVGVACQPGDFDANGDFLKIEDCNAQYTIIPLSVGNTQSRAVALSRFDANGFHTYVTTNTHGRQLGQLGGLWTNITTGGGYRWFRLGPSAFTGPLKINGFYAEDFQRLGDIAAGAAGSGAVIEIDGGAIIFNHQIAAGKRGVPLYQLGSLAAPAGAAGVESGWSFRRVRFTNFKGVAPMMMARTKFEDCEFFEVDAATAPTTQWQARARNTLAGGLVVPRHVVNERPLLTYQPANETTPALTAVTTTGRVNRTSSRDYPMSLYTHSVGPLYAMSAEEIINPQVAYGQPKNTASLFGSLTLTGRSLTFTATAGVSVLNENGLHPGGVIIDDDNGMIFVIQTRTGAGPYSFTCELENGYRYLVGGAIAYEMPFSTTAGNFYIAGGGLFTPRLPMFGNLDTTLTTINSVASANGTNWHTTDVQPGDRLFIDEQFDQPFYPGVAATGVVAGTITMNGSALYNATKKRLPLWVRGS